ncbi:hypothetical protein DLR11_06135 [Salmonella enterica subsp. salamae]|uniref:Uncharacterized protein n=1 Tax=Salmonella enterica subsp. salamae TaxID=59202 RepID=A0A5Y3UZ52_SALER|nr:hypothetical protein [Salmonella enterica subsp. salamae]EDH0693095.1 hypothetical protein [Salmonella enterica]EHM1749643.1 hypothetical protein [Salmonella enterica subsp. salamae serovar 40:c:e,n,x,z15]ECG8514945.1 hypothetical protein [Salmonella enterica subsp. salamae]ECI3451437.1 hypothetical protein [Salmonella enterica subsp. salamae]
MYTVLGMQQTTISNIPMNISEGYGKSYSGKIYFPDGRFGMYAVVGVLGSNGEPLNTRYESDACYSVTFSELPCDIRGNILLDHYELTAFQKTTAPEMGVNSLQVMLICSQEPTHRVNLRTGELYTNIEDNAYIENMSLSYIISKR